jgi:hypothetical protein
MLHTTTISGVKRSQMTGALLIRALRYVKRDIINRALRRI